MRYKLTVSYDGSMFNGYQKQSNQRTIQGEIEKAILLVCKEEVKVHASGRTDTGVHAKAQVLHFDTSLQISAKDMQNALNATLPDDIYVRLVNRVSSDFHSRYHAKGKEYQYLINFGEYNPLLRNYVLQYCRELNVEKMIEASKHLLGEHDFSAFTTNCVVENRVRRIDNIDIVVSNNSIIITIKGNGFLRYMVRCIVGTLIDVGRGRFEVDDVKDILDSKNRGDAGPSVDSCGLYLLSVLY